MYIVMGKGPTLACKRHEASVAEDNSTAVYSDQYNIKKRHIKHLSLNPSSWSFLTDKQRSQKTENEKKFRVMDRALR